MNVQQKFDKLINTDSSKEDIKSVLIELFSNPEQLKVHIDSYVDTNVPVFQAFLEFADYDVIATLLTLHNAGTIDIFASKDIELFNNLYLACLQVAYYIEFDIRDIEKYNFPELYKSTISIKRNYLTEYNGNHIDIHRFEISKSLDILKKAKLPLAQIQSILYNPLYSSWALVGNVEKLLKIYQSEEDRISMIEIITRRIDGVFTTPDEASRVFSAMRMILSDFSNEKIVEFIETHKNDLKFLFNLLPEQMNLFVAMVYLNA